MNKKYLMVVLGMMMLGAGCSSAPKTVDLENVGKEEVLKKYGKNDELKEVDQFLIESGVVKATGMATIAADAGRPESAIKIAQANARAIVAKNIQTKLSAFFSVASENTSVDSTEVRELITESTKLIGTEWKIGPTYYERVKIISDNGVPRTEIRAWSQILLDEQIFKKHVIESLRQQEGKMGVSAEFHKSVSKNWEKLIGNDVEAKDEDARKPASESKPESTKQDEKVE